MENVKQPVRLPWQNENVHRKKSEKENSDDLKINYIFAVLNFPSSMVSYGLSTLLI